MRAPITPVVTGISSKVSSSGFQMTILLTFPSLRSSLPYEAFGFYLELLPSFAYPGSAVEADSASLISITIEA
jgi:hypothetical protein